MLVENERANGAIYDSLLLPDGKTLHAGNCAFAGSSVCLFKYEASGAPDTSFAQFGRAQLPALGGKIPENNDFYGRLGGRVATTATGMIVIAATCSVANTSSYVFCVFRYSENGTLDTSFGQNGIATVSIGGVGRSFAYSLRIQNDGKILVAGSCVVLDTAWSLEVPSRCAARFLDSGMLDTTFGEAGKFIGLRAPFGAAFSESSVTQLEIAVNGDLFLLGTCGVTRFPVCILKLSGDGVVEEAYGVLGDADVIAYTGPVSGFRQFQALRVYAEPDNSLSVYGRCAEINSTGSLCVMRLTPSGAADLAFGTNGYFLFEQLGMDTRTILRTNNGLLVSAGACGSATGNEFCVARYRPDGTLDPSFGTNGRSVLTTKEYGFFVNFNGAYTLLIQPDGRFLAAGGCSNPLFAVNPVCIVRLDGGVNQDLCSLDVDGDGVLTSTTDALLLTRVALGISGEQVTAGITFAQTATRTTWEAVRDRLASVSVDFDGDGRMLPHTDALLASRLLFGFRGEALVQGLSFPGMATRRTWPAIRDYATTRCGMTLQD